MYEYCLSRLEIQSLSPISGLVIINLHNFNGEGCISQEAREIGKALNVQVFTTNEFYRFAHNKLKKWIILL